MGDIIGWDVGGAHLKAARIRDTAVVDIVQLPCPLWQGLPHLEEAISAMRQQLGDAPRHAVTTTGELTDLFESRSQGVAALVDTMRKHLAPAELAVYAGAKGFVTAEAAVTHAASVASANWHATAALIARRCGHAILIDLGSTTTDIIPICNGQVIAIAHNDAERLAASELVYTGLTRSFLMAECEAIPFRGQQVPLMKEYFANMADIYRILDLLDDGHDQHATADGRDRSKANSQARLARMLGMDRDDAGAEEWQLAARWVMQTQLRRIEDAIHIVGTRTPALAMAPLIAAGVGEKLVHELARRLQREVIAFNAAIGFGSISTLWDSACAPAVAVGLLLEDQ